MSRIATLVFSQALLCALATYLVSRISLIGKVGVALFYKEYKILRSSWKTFLLFFGIQLVVILIQYLMHSRQPRKNAMLASGGLLVAGVLGLAITYYDFQHTYSHRLLKERFHLGFYLFWLGWMVPVFFSLLPEMGKSPAGNRTRIRRNRRLLLRLQSRRTVSAYKTGKLLKLKAVPLTATSLLLFSIAEKDVLYFGP